MRGPILLTLLLWWLSASSQTPYWQQEVNYRIDVSLNDKEHTLDGFAKIKYYNHSPDTLRFIWFHCWPNAYKNDRTAFSDQFLENGNISFYFSRQEEKGYMNRLDFKVNDITAATEDHPQHPDIIKLVLPAPLAPAQSIEITTPFHVKLPFNFSRGGHDGQSYQATQWYPKPAVYDREGWHPLPYLDQGEFYSEFGSFEVQITVPRNYVVAATGELQNEEELAWLKSRSSFDWQPVKQKITQPNTPVKTTYQLFPESETATKTLRYKQDRVHDFAWFADKRFIVRSDTCRLASGKVIGVTAYYTPAERDTWYNSVAYTKNAVRHYSTLVGEYPYNVVSVVQGPRSFGGGMEYPTITVLSPEKDSSALENTIVHEVGHNWFYGILGSNERRYPWMDEGMNSFYELKYAAAHAGRPPYGMTERLLDTRIEEKKDQPISTSSEKFSEMNYWLIAYRKAASWMAMLEEQLGAELFKRCLQEYFRQWQFRHPGPADLQRVMEQVSERNLGTAFALLDETGPLPGSHLTGTRLSLPAITRTGSKPAVRNQLSLLPVVGFNSYDKLMAGALITNLQLPPNRFQFLVAPMYATGSAKPAGIGFANLAFYPGGPFRKIDIGISGSVFSADRFTGEDNQKTWLGFTKLAPGIRFYFREKDPRSTFYRYLQFSSYWLHEEGLRFYRDTLINGSDTTVKTKFRKRYDQRTLHQLRLVIENNRALYPYRGEWKLEQGNDFLRAAFTGNYFFNYGKTGGLNARLFAGKFFYTSSKTFSRRFATDRYHLNMTGANGYEDYTYSDYFIGRNQFSGLASQQIMVRDGGFKVRTDLLADKVGKTDDWLVAANFTSTIPASINPLSVLPVKIPLRVFLDVGTYAEAWKRNANLDRFIFDAGLQLSFLKETVNIYLPFLYSGIFKDYIRSTLPKKERFWKRISFSIDISHFSLRKFDRNLDF